MLLYWIKYFFSNSVALGLSLFRTFLCYWDSLILLWKDIYCILGNVRPRFNFASFAFIVSGRIKDWANSNVKNTPHLTQLCLGELKIAGWNRVKIALFTVSADFQVFGFEEMSIYENLRFGKQKSHQKYTIIMSAN